MTDRPIMLRAPVIKSIRAGQRTHMVLAASFVPGKRLAIGDEARARAARIDGAMRLPTPWTKLQQGDRLWVQEEMAFLVDRKNAMGSKAVYKCELPTGIVPIPGGSRGERYRTGTTDASAMKREDSRFFLEVVGVRLFRAREITWEEIKAEGAFDPQQTMGAWWQYRYGYTMPWTENPEACGITFRFRDGNIDTGEVWTMEKPTYENTRPLPIRIFGTRPVND